MIDEMNKVGVVGLGVMGFDIAFLYAMRGCQTFVYDAAKAAMDSLTWAQRADHRTAQEEEPDFRW